MRLYSSTKVFVHHTVYIYLYYISIFIFDKIYHTACKYVNLYIHHNLFFYILIKYVLIKKYHNKNLLL